MTWLSRFGGWLITNVSAQARLLARGRPPMSFHNRLDFYRLHRKVELRRRPVQHPVYPDDYRP